ncbi:bifunctional glutamate N-acetyltransferase/amino-acid acetyltransferase ArgJ [Trichloromonas sp.]|uniref:bifunctional glutamate N-acetyltransferase/amino-acid acetyltransferase ArgJ n=1 Tax=Trichloromonas sp. TaxID=3069249 RepID=UPI002A3A7648|nr:bifunctional glutamate N-acetyltransferase/amino-acid acetyltransferase ArgJ [Trichloromonas sp.]
MNRDDLHGVAGFRFAAGAAGLKKSGRLDMALIVADKPAVCAGVFTTNKVVAAPVQISAPRVRRGRCQAVLVNSGNANACTGEQGRQDALRCGVLAARALNIDEELVAVSSTGVIGAPLAMAKFEEQVPKLAAQLGEDHADEVAVAIMTTDSFAKRYAVTGEIDGRPFRLLGVAKGAGMIHPNMATMLAFVMTDAELEPAYADRALRTAVDRSFNCITVDRDTSTNDMVLLLASGVAGNAPIAAGSKADEAFQTLLDEVLLELAKMIVRDGEGATKLVRVEVTGAASDAEARQAACSVATSSLVKTAFFGQDANWGRIIAAVGYSGAQVDPEKVDIRFGEIPVVKDGLGTGKELEAKATEILKTPEFTVTVDLKLGSGRAYYYTSDLTYDYVKINADYRS